MDTAVPPTPEELQSLIRKTLQNWHKPDPLIKQQWGQLKLVKQTCPRSPDDGRSTTTHELVRQILGEALDDLDSQDPSAADVLRRRFLKKQSLNRVVLDLGTDRFNINRIQKKAYKQLAIIIAAKEDALQVHHLKSLEECLPAPSYTHLFGLDQIQLQIAEKLVRPGTPWILTLTGIGGIGKTALADGVTRQALQSFQFEKVAWVRIESLSLSGQISGSSDQILHQLITNLSTQLAPDLSPLNRLQQESRLKQLFKTSTCLVIIDNLEREADAAFLFDHLRQWANPSKFLITSRAWPAGYHTVWMKSLEELPLTDSLALIRYEAEQSNLKELMRASEDELLPIYDVTGGNPLALRLALGLAHFMPLTTILSELALSRPGPTEEMYRHIYWKSWQSLNTDARQLLGAMPLIGDVGARPEQMQAMSELEEVPFWAAVRDLVARSLLEVRGTTWDRRYGIHRLTETFLQTEIIHWPTEKNG